MSHIIINLQTIFCILFILIRIKCASANLTGDPNHGKLILTPLIHHGRLKEARELSKVVNLTKYDFLSYAGYFNVDTECKGLLYFWFIPAAYDIATAPVILWQGGGPGSSGIGGAFIDNGPFLIDDEGQPQLRPYAWTLTRSMIYIDSPLGTGFSVTDSRKECQVTTTIRTAEHVYEALTQFFQVFPEFYKNDFYIFTGSYGGKFGPAIAHEIYKGNKEKAININLQGLCIASGFTDPINQIDYGDFYYSIGLIDDVVLGHFKRQESHAKECILQSNWQCAFDLVEPLVIGTEGVVSELRNATGIAFPYNFGKNLKEVPRLMKNHVPFLNKLNVQLALKVGNFQNFSSASNEVYINFKEDIYQSLRSLMEEILDVQSSSSEYYKVLIISNQNDLIVPHTTIRNFLANLHWRGSGQFKSTVAVPWLLEGEHHIVTGYEKNVENLSYLFLRNTGHIWILDQPKIAFEVMERFTKRLTTKKLTTTTINRNSTSYRNFMK